jgi:protein-S-isoprenylcysteine O-methyltransferase Ste14
MEGIVDKLWTYVETARYVMAVLVLISLVPACIFWFVIHPFIGFWRRIGRFGATLTGAASMIASMAAFFWYREAVLESDFGTQIWLWLPAAALLAIAASIERARKKYLRFNILTGGPEFEGDGEASALLQEGVYARMRHPRYFAYALGALGWALFANYLGLYLYVLVSWAVIYTLMVVEERELRGRFGVAYEAYARRVPRLPKHFWKISPIP